MRLLVSGGANSVLSGPWVCPGPTDNTALNWGLSTEPASPTLDFDSLPYRQELVPRPFPLPIRHWGLQDQYGASYCPLPSSLFDIIPHVDLFNSKFCLLVLNPIYFSHISLFTSWPSVVLIQVSTFKFLVIMITPFHLFNLCAFTF